MPSSTSRGLGTNANLDVPRRYDAKGLGHGGAKNCPADHYCVENAGPYRSPMSVSDALAQSPNTAFVKLIQSVGVPQTVDMAVRLGLRSYANPNTSGHGNQSLSDMFKEQNLGSFTLGPVAVNPLELSNVATLPIKLWPGMKIGQLCFFQLTSPAEHPYGSSEYGSHYQGQRGPTPSKSYLNFR